MEHSTEILYNRTRVYCSAVHRFGSDALLLARFSEPKRAWRAADLCSGCGIVSLEWHDRGHRGPCLGLELQPEASALLAAACTEQDIEHITPVCADLRSFREGEGSYDLCACIDAPQTIQPGARAVFPSGLAAEIPAGTAGFIFTRSGLGIKKGIHMTNGVGVVDSDYRGEITFTNKAAQQMRERIAQMIIMPYFAPEIVEVASLSETDRGAGGFGSTGK